MNSRRMPKERWLFDPSRPLAETLTSIRDSVEGFINGEEARATWNCPFAYRTAASYSLGAGGKRLRPALVILSAHATDAAPVVTDDELLAVAVSVEMIHTYSLVHDDLPCMDDDDVRRGLPSCHAVFGVEAATWAGSALLVHAFECLRQGFSASGRVPEGARVLGEAAGFSGMVGGQCLDLELPSLGVSSDQYAEVHSRKTAALMAGSCVLGGLAGGSDDTSIAALHRYGWHLGMAFQATDDLLDVTGEEQVIGKKVGKDASAGKVTAISALGVEGTKRHAQEHVRRATASITLLTGPAAPLLRALAPALLDRGA